ncbi:MAG TPA: YdeI/OmpD-associated family protein [Chthoniobacterales bacterium]|nr:YdeI/OmpD-associated family protein [Chthoniobacterales bacterium]
MKPTTKEPESEPSAPKGGPIKFHTKIFSAGKTATGIQIPDEVIQGLGAGKRPPIRVTINGQTYRSTVAVMGGKFMVGVSAENRAKTGVAGGDEIDVEIALDTEPREVTVPAGFAQALKANPGAKKKFDALSYSKKRGFVSGIEGAKTQETRERRIEKAIEQLKRL